MVRQAAPGAISGDEARSLVTLLGQAERAVASGIALLAPVVLETGSYAKEGHATAADWLGEVAGSSAGVAKGRLAAAERAASSPELARALHGAELSAAELKMVTDTAKVAPEAAATLLPLVAERASHQELSDAAARMRSAARCAETARARRARVHVQRHVRWRQDPHGGIRGEFFCDEVAWAGVGPVLEAEAKARAKAAGAGEPLEAHRLDALIALLSGARPRGRGTPRPRAIVLVDARALRRGHAQRDEVCEIEGVGPVSVDAATELLGEAGLQFVVQDGVDVRTVTGTSRSIGARLDTALLVRDRVCVVPGCGRRLGLERDHWQVDFGHDGPTALANLARLCGPHHDMKTHGGWRLGGGPGHWTWEPPEHPPSAGYIARARRLAAAKAKRE